MVITGVIRPPPEIRAVADRTASYVAKNGRTFEARILNSAKGKTPKFAFLQPTSPFHAYYEDRIKFYEDGGDDSEEKKENETPEESTPQPAPEPSSKPAPHNEAIRKREKSKVASAIDPVAKALLAQRSKILQAKSQQRKQIEGSEETDDASRSVTAMSAISPPPTMDFVNIVAPTNVSPSKMENMQLVAQFAALDGKGGTFLHQLSIREWSNSEFSFCQPRHAHFAYFSALVDAYRRIITEWTAVAAEKSDDKSPPNDMPEKSIQSILDEAAYRAEYEREREQQRSQQQEEGEVVVVDWHDFVVVETIDFPEDEKVELSMLPPPPPPPSTNTEAKPTGAAGETMDVSDDEEGEAIRVVPSYTPRVVGTANPQTARAIDPITGKSVPVADLPEHLRIQLLDPKWAEERKKFQDKQKESNLVAGDAIVNNLSRYSQARGDLFGKSEQELLDNEKDSKRRLEEANKIIREQASNPSVAFPPATPTASSPAVVTQTSEPAAKRMRMDGPSANSAAVTNVPPPPPPPPTQVVAPPPPPPPEGGGASSGGETSGNPMADAMLLANNSEADLSGSHELSESDFAASLSKPEVTLQIRIPNDPTQMAWNFYGQIVSLKVDVMATIKQVKSDISRIQLNGMPANKIQLKYPAIGFLNNNNATLAALNIGPTATLELVPKTRGGRR